MSAEHASTGDSYEANVHGLEKLGVVVTRLVDAILTAAGINYHSAQFRVKAAESATRKLLSKPEKYEGYNSLTDLLGVRIITYFEDDVDRVADLLEAEFQVDRDNSEDKRALLESDQFGYLSVHYILSLSIARCHLVEYTEFSGVQFEVQIRTVLQHAWAEIEHDLGYKIDTSLPRELRRGFSKLASVLEVADGEFRALRDRISAYEADVEEKIVSAPRTVPLNQTSIAELLDSNDDVRSLEVAVVETLGFNEARRLSKNYLTRQANYLETAGVRNVEALLEYVDRHRSNIIAFAKTWIENRPPGHPVMRKHDTPPRGISMFYVVLYALSNLSKRERVKILEEMDLPMAIERFAYIEEKRDGSTT